MHQREPGNPRTHATVAIAASFAALLLGACGRAEGDAGPPAVRAGRHAIDTAAAPGAGVDLRVYGKPGGCVVRPVDGPVVMPRNVILLVGDGMGPEQVAAGRELAGGRLHMDTLAHHTRLVTDSRTTLTSPANAPTDSAAAATAMATGLPAYNGSLGVLIGGRQRPTALDHAQRAGRATGLVTTSYLLDATPMAFAVHGHGRSSLQAILSELLSRSPVDVLLGGGGMLLRAEGLDLPALAKTRGYDTVLDARQLGALPARHGTRVLGLFTATRAGGAEHADIAWPTTPAYLRGPASTDPSLAEMTRAALRHLARDPDGLFLVVEDEATDELGHHSAEAPELARRAIADEVRHFDAAVGASLEWVAGHGGFEDTLVVVTADHETGAYRHAAGAPRAGRFHSSTHTRTPVDLFASGPGADRVASMCWLGDVYQLMTGGLR